MEVTDILMKWIMEANKNSSAQGKAKEGGEDEKNVQAQTFSVKSVYMI